MGYDDRYSTAGSLAAALREATELRAVAEVDVADLLATLYPGWRPMFPPERAWRFTSPDAIDVYFAIDSPAAASALHLAGFTRVTAHAHPGGEESCRCEAHVRPPEIRRRP